MNLLKDVFLAFLVLVSVGIVASDGVGGLVRVLVKTVLYIPGAKTLLNWYLKKEAKGFLRQAGVQTSADDKARVKAIPQEGSLKHVKVE